MGVASRRDARASARCRRGVGIQLIRAPARSRRGGMRTTCRRDDARVRRAMMGRCARGGISRVVCVVARVVASSRRRARRETRRQ